ncbi:MAG TPA: LapA family protein [Rhodopila sp.]|uniref:LapA family protein n=1 Tax=Rhodopila sp. TaxID=2480087 RepID=UPI002C85C7B4|nr:LapA family protein [Rhodopila sp.]HVY16903.1 LapA family protein [Rhodopila sp.]
MFLILFVLIICIPLSLFALSNTEMVTLGIWPTDYMVQVHLSLAILVAMAVAFFLGGLLVWFSALAQRRRANRAERTVKLLEAQIEELKARPALAISASSS